MFACRWGLILASQGWNPATSMVDVLKEVWFGKLIATSIDMRWWIMVVHLFQKVIEQVMWVKSTANFVVFCCKGGMTNAFPIWSWVIWHSHPCFPKTWFLRAVIYIYIIYSQCICKLPSAFAEPRLFGIQEVYGASKRTFGERHKKFFIPCWGRREDLGVRDFLSLWRRGMFGRRAWLGRVNPKNKPWDTLFDQTPKTTIYKLMIYIYIYIE